MNEKEIMRVVNRTGGLGGYAARAAVLVMALFASLLLGASADARHYPGVFPKPHFGTPGTAAYCYVGPNGYEDQGPKLSCWTPNDGWYVSISWQDGRARKAYYNDSPQIAHGIGNLRGYAPPARTLRFGQTWTYTVGAGRVAFRCTSRTTGLTCTNARGHGWWIGRYRGYRLF